MRSRQAGVELPKMFQNEEAKNANQTQQWEKRFKELTKYICFLLRRTYHEFFELFLRNIINF